MGKIVRVAIEMDEHFVRMLQANVGLSGGMDGTAYHELLEAVDGFLKVKAGWDPKALRVAPDG